jgi:ankyrin repeat protein
VRPDASAGPSTSPLERMVTTSANRLGASRTFGAMGLWVAIRLLTACTPQPDIDLVDAALSGDLPKVQALLSQGANVEADAFDGLTPLDAAAKNGHLEVLRYLIDHGASVNGLEHSDRTALSMAAIYEHTDCVEYLISKGGEIRGTPQWKQGLLDAIHKDGKVELYNLLKAQLSRESTKG